MFIGVVEVRRAAACANALEPRRYCGEWRSQQQSYEGIVLIVRFQVLVVRAPTLFISFVHVLNRCLLVTVTVPLRSRGMFPLSQVLRLTSSASCLLQVKSPFGGDDADGG